FGYLVDYPKIKYFMGSKTPTSDILKYLNGARYLEFDTGYKTISYKANITKRRLTITKHLYIGFYYITAMLGLFMIKLIPDMPMYENRGLAMYLLTIASLLFLAYLSIEESTKPKSAIDLIERT
ncbi:hypothetical protein, partial [Photobacterium profundum]|uniref:hypothetical protein n=1 Tax=Photobacterium profundum TaxID=74109 RepID=UPI003D1167BE